MSVKGSISSGIKTLQMGYEPEWLDDLPDHEHRFLTTVAEMYETLGLRPEDFRPDNLGWDTDGNLVVIDIKTIGV